MQLQLTGSKSLSNAAQDIFCLRLAVVIPTILIQGDKPIGMKCLAPVLSTQKGGVASLAIPPMDAETTTNLEKVPPT